MKNKGEALVIAEQINFLLNNNILSNKLFDNCPCEIFWDNSVFEWNDKDDEKCRKELIKNQNKFTCYYHKIEDDNYGIVFEYTDSAKIDKFVKDIHKHIKSLETGYNNVHDICFHFFDDSSINIELIEENNKISKVGLIGWFVNEDNKSYTDIFRKEFKNKLQKKLS